MSTITRTYTFSDGTSAYGSQVESEISNIVNSWNNHDGAVSAWTQLKVSGVAQFSAGTSALPSIAFSTSTTTGFFYDNSGKIFGFALNGTRRFYYQEGTPPSLNFDSGVQVSAADGTVSLPGYGFNSETNSGLYRIGSHDIALCTNGIKALEINSSQQILGVTGTGALPTFASQAHPTSGLAINSTGGVVILTINGTDVIDVSATKLEPAADNTVGLGESGVRYTSVWAANGTIQTSHSDFKTDITEIINPAVPKGIFYRWKDMVGTKEDRIWAGFLADSLQPECFAHKEDGSIDKMGVNLGSVVGNLCAGYWGHDARLKALEEKLNGRN